jgi:hypothetical protein
MSSGVIHAVQSESTQVNGLRVCLCVYWHSGLVYACGQHTHQTLCTLAVNSPGLKHFHDADRDLAVYLLYWTC